MRLLISGVLLAGGLFFTADGLWLQAKAVLAQHLLQLAWSRHLDDGRHHKPWPWADTWPVARLRLPAHDTELLVLEGDSGRNLAFGPAHAAGSAAPGERGTLMISGHRDTHFRILRQVGVGNRIALENRHGTFWYVVREIRILDAGRQRINAAVDESLLVLVTCYPFDALDPGGPLRYVVFAEGAGPPPLI